MSAFLKIALALLTPVGGNNVPNLKTSQLHARARGKRDSDHLSEFFSKPSRGRRPGLFKSEWTDLVTGKRTRATRAQLREAYRLWAVHRDIRLGRIGGGES